MSGPVYFGVVKWHDRERPRLFFDEVPPAMFLKNSPLIYCTRIDLFPNGDKLVSAPLYQLMAVFQALRREGRAPPEDRGRKPAQKQIGGE